MGKKPDAPRIPYHHLNPRAQMERRAETNPVLRAKMIENDRIWSDQ